MKKKLTSRQIISRIKSLRDAIGEARYTDVRTFKVYVCLCEALDEYDRAAIRKRTARKGKKNGAKK